MVFTCSVSRPNVLQAVHPFNHRNDVLSYCKDGANLYGRKYAIMYDLSGLAAGETQKVIDDWKWLIDNGRVSQNPAYDPAYIFYKSKPVVAVYGVALAVRRTTHIWKSKI